MLINTENKDIFDSPMQETKDINPPCVNCQATSFEHILQGYDFDTGNKKFSLESCSNCGLTRTYPVLTESEISSYYEPNYYGSSEQKFNPLVESWTVWNNNRLANKILQTSRQSNANGENIPRVLDIGCGRANLLKAFKRKGCECFGVERTDFPADPDLDSITIYKEDLENIPFEENSFDIIVIWHVLEHLVDPAATLKRVQQILKSDGELIIAVPNFGSLQSRLFDKHWFHLDLPRHTYHFTRKSLTTIIQNNGLSVKSITTGGLDQGIFGFVQSAINQLQIDKPNALYAVLKTTQQKPNVAVAAVQIIIAGILSPIAILEYVISRIAGKGTCVMVRSTK